MVPGEGLKVLGFSALMRHSMACPEKVDFALLQRERRARRDPDLFDHEIEPGDHFGHRMLHLETRVHLDEEELAVLIEELDGAGAAVFELPHRRGDCLADLVALVGVEGRGRRLFPDFLVAALQRTVALAQMDGVAFAVAEHLDLDVARLCQIFLEVDAVVAEGCLRLRARRLDGAVEVFGRVGHLHAAAAAAGCRLDQDRIAHVLGDPWRLRQGR